jgi:hypothetical protein
MFCTRCGTANPDNNLFCSNCNAELKRPTTPQRPAVTERQGGEYKLPAFPESPQTPEAPYPGYRSSYTPPQQIQGSASGRAIASMIFCLVALVTCFPLLSIPGWILGKQELDAIRAGQAPFAGETFAKIGYYGGIILTVLSCLWIPAVFYWLTVGIIGIH